MLPNTGSVVSTQLKHIINLMNLAARCLNNGCKQKTNSQCLQFDNLFIFNTCTLLTHNNVDYN